MLRQKLPDDLKQALPSTDEIEVGLKAEVARSAGFTEVAAEQRIYGIREARGAGVTDLRNPRLFRAFVYGKQKKESHLVMRLLLRI